MHVEAKVKQSFYTMISASIADLVQISYFTGGLQNGDFLIPWFLPHLLVGFLLYEKKTPTFPWGSSVFIYDSYFIMWCAVSYQY